MSEAVETGNEADWQRLDRRTILATALALAGVAVAAGVPTTVGIADDNGIGVALAWVLPLAVLLILGGAGLDYLRWRATTYRVTADRVELRFNLVVHSAKTLARERVRTVDVTANPLLRIFGLAELTAGTGQGDNSQDRVKLSPLRRAVADRLRQDLLQRGETPVAVHTDGALATLDPTWARFAPVSVVVPTIGVAAFGAALQVSEWFGVQSGVIDWVGELFLAQPVLFILLIIALGLVIGVVGSLALFVEFWWNYRLEREPNGTLRVRRGLLTTRSVSIEESRLRGVELLEPLGNRAVGAARVDAVATGMRKTGENNKTEYKTLLPAAPRKIADQVAADVLRETAPPTAAVTLTGHPRAARGRRLRWALGAAVLFCAILALLGFLLTPVFYWLTGAALVVLTPIAVLLALDAYRNLGHGITGNYLVTRYGTVRRSTVALQRAGVLGWTFRQSIFQRRAGLVTITAVTAAGSGGYEVLDAGEQEGLVFAEQAVPELLTQFLERG